ncbi:hypothetical protein RSAG8_13394, partial [Rhizoctonia solani AG-8 WAC10335]
QINPPKLRKIGIWELRPFETQAAVVEAFVKSLKALEELEFGHGVEHYVEFIGALAGADHLRQIKLDHDKILQCAKRDSDPGLIPKWEDVMADLISMCPRLELIVGKDKGRGNPQWRILRQGSDEPRIVQIGSST